MLSCYLYYRKRIGAWLDDALPADGAASVARHVEQCERCAGEAGSLRQLRVAVRNAAMVAEPDWTGFWPGVVRGIEDAKRAPAVARTRAWPRLRWAYSGALAAALLVTITTLWQFRSEPLAPELPAIVRSADTGYPGGQVMVYSTPEQDLTVVWVLGADGD